MLPHVVTYDIIGENNTGIIGCVLPHVVAYDIIGENNTGITGCVLPHVVAYAVEKITLAVCYHMPGVILVSLIA